MTEGAHFLAIKPLSVKTTRASCADAVILNVMRHNARELQAEIGVSADGKIDASRVHLNVTLHGPATAAGVASAARDAMRAHGIVAPRKNATLGIEIVASLPAGLPIDHLAYFRDTMAWAQQHYRVPLLSAIVHHDEGSPHLHLVLLPVRDGKLVGSELLGNRATLQAMQKDFHEQVARQYGLRMPAAKKRHSAAQRAAGITLLHDTLQANSGLTDHAIDALLVPHARNPEPLLVALGLAMPAPVVKGSFVATMTRKVRPESPSRSFKKSPIGDLHAQIDGGLEAENEMSYALLGLPISAPNFPPSASPSSATDSAPSQQASSRSASQPSTTGQQRERSTTDAGNPASPSSTMELPHDEVVNCCATDQCQPAASVQNFLHTPRASTADTARLSTATSTPSSATGTGLTLAHIKQQPSVSAAPLVATTNPSASPAPRKRAAKPRVASPTPATSTPAGTDLTAPSVDQASKHVVEQAGQQQVQHQAEQHHHQDVITHGSAPTAHQQARQHPSCDGRQAATTAPTKRAAAQRQPKSVTTAPATLASAKSKRKRTAASVPAGTTLATSTLSPAQHQAASIEQQHAAGPADQVATTKTRNRVSRSTASASPAPSKRTGAATATPSAPAAPRTGKRKPATCTPAAALSTSSARARARPPSSTAMAPGPASTSASKCTQAAAPAPTTSRLPRKRATAKAMPVATMPTRCTPSTSPATAGTAPAARRKTAKSRAAGIASKPGESRFDDGTGQAETIRAVDGNLAQRVRSTSRPAPAKSNTGNSRNYSTDDQPDEIRRLGADDMPKRTRSTSGPVPVLENVGESHNCPSADQSDEIGTAAQRAPARLSSRTTPAVREDASTFGCISPAPGIDGSAPLQVAAIHAAQPAEAHPTGGAWPAPHLLTLQGDQLKSALQDDLAPPDDGYQRQRDDEHPTECWDSERGEFVTMPTRPARSTRTAAARCTWPDAADMAGLWSEARPAAIGAALASVLALRGAG